MFANRFLTIAAVSAVAISGAALAPEISPNDFRISEMGTNGDTAVPANRSG